MDFPCIALLTDFGEQDGFVGAMKGVILSRLTAPVPLVDIGHGIEPQNIRQGAWVLESVHPYFPPKTVWVAVVDPAVGSAGQASLIAWWPERQQVFIAPDNGLLTPILEAAGDALQVHDIRGSALYQDDGLSLHGRSQTFHGRDVYAPLAALAANALMEDAFSEFWASLAPDMPLKNDWKPVMLHRQPPRKQEMAHGLRLTGEIVAADRFGNLMTNIPHGWCPAGSLWSVSIDTQDFWMSPFVPAYTEGRNCVYNPYSVVLVPSSGGGVELAVFQGSARQALRAGAGQSIRLDEAL